MICFENRARKFVRFLIVFVFFMVTCGCASHYSASNRVLAEFSREEMHASKYGMVSAGAVRVTDYSIYNSTLDDVRTSLVNGLLILQKDILNASIMNTPIAPEGYKSIIHGFMFGIEWAKGKSVTNSTKNDGFSEKLQEQIQAKTPKPGLIDRIGFRLAAAKFIESQLEDLLLDEIYPTKDDYRRMVVSIDFTAWIRGKAKAVLVYVDMYPFHADEWCAKDAGNILKEQSDKAKTQGQEIEGKTYQDEWNKSLLKLYEKTYNPSNQTKVELEKSLTLRAWAIPEEGLKDPIGFCHDWLGRNQLLPNLIHVERFAESEYLVLGGGEYSQAGFGLGLPFADITAKTRKQTEHVRANVRPLSLGFAAGKQRAGWLFLPSELDKGRMPPTERRLRMVVDIPKDLSRLNIHVHKIFLGRDLKNISDADFAKQMERLRDARLKLDLIEDQYRKQYSKSEGKAAGQEDNSEDYFASTTHYRLIKSRMRNLLYLGWSEELKVDIPPLVSNSTGNL